MNIRTPLALLVVAGLAACSSLQGDKVDYRSATQAKPASLEVPPDLTQLTRDSRYIVPGGPVTASSYQTTQAQGPTVATAAAAVGDVRIERTGNQRWLVVGRTPEQLWTPLREFWTEAGFTLTQDQPELGIMETDWAENRAKIPQDFIRRTLGKVLDSLYSTSERDRFRTRIERGASGTEVYITHRGMQEVYVDNTNSRTTWQPRPADPELEAEFLRRLMVKLGVPQEQTQAQVAAGSAPRSISRIASVNNTPVLQIDEAFDRAWRRVGLALDRTGFTVEDRDRSQGLYFVRYVEPNAGSKEPGFFARMFSGNSATPAPLKYRIAVRGEGNATTVSVLNASGAPESSANAQRIVQVLADDIK